MKRQLLIFILLVTIAGPDARADAGFSISRRKPGARITFEGTANLSGYTLVRYYMQYNDTDWKKTNPQMGRMDTVNDEYYDYIQNGGRHWEESDRNVPFALLDTAGHITDSFTLFMKKYDNHLIISGVKNGKLQYTIKKKKAVFEYGVASYDGDDASHRTARLIFILCSLTGVAALAVLFVKKRKTQTA